MPCAPTRATTLKSMPAPRPTTASASNVLVTLRVRARYGLPTESARASPSRRPRPVDMNGAKQSAAPSGISARPGPRETVAGAGGASFASGARSLSGHRTSEYGEYGDIIRNSRCQPFAIVVDEYGGRACVIPVEDVVA